MHKQTLKNLLQYHRDVQFKQFCSEIFPDFRLSESYGYLSGKFSLFQVIVIDMHMKQTIAVFVKKCDCFSRTFITE